MSHQLFCRPGFKPFLAIWFLLFPFLIACSLNSYSGEDLASVSVFVGYGSKALALESEYPDIEFRYLVTDGNKAPDVENRSSWSVLEFENGEGKISDLTAGSHTVYLDGYVGSVRVYSGQKDVVLSPGTRQSIEITMSKISSDVQGSIVMNFTSGAQTVTVKYRKITQQAFSEFYITGTGSETRNFSKNINLDDGSYEFIFYSFTDGIMNGGQTVAFDVISGCTISITGDLEQYILVSGADDIKSVTSADIKVGQSRTFAYVGNGEPCTCMWYLDNQPESESSVYRFESTKGGDHVLECRTDNGNYAVNIKSYYKETDSLTMWDVFDCLKNTDIICDSIKIGDTELINQNLYPITVYKTVYEDKPESLDQIGAVMHEVTVNDIGSSTKLVIGKNAALSADSSKGWLNQNCVRYSNSTLRECYCYKNIDEYAFYGCDGIINLGIGDTVTTVGAHSLCGTYLDIIYEGAVPANWSDLAYK